MLYLLDSLMQSKEKIVLKLGKGGEVVRVVNGPLQGTAAPPHPPFPAPFGATYCKPYSLKMFEYESFW